IVLPCRLPQPAHIASAVLLELQEETSLLAAMSHVVAARLIPVFTRMPQTLFSVMLNISNWV
ncbi:MAG TPA: hypothetical protein DET40_18555, partial [Lentisphaeria bacterium]|nr:hypothetical protein [Lentisphaeria bacterium]